MEDQSIKMTKDKLSNHHFSSIEPSESETIYQKQGTKAFPNKKVKNGFDYNYIDNSMDTPNNILALNVQNQSNEKENSEEISIENLGRANKNKLFGITTCSSFFRYGSLLSSLFFLISLLISVFMYYFDGSKNKASKGILSFQFYNGKITPFQLNEYALLFFFSILILLIISFSVCIIRNDENCRTLFKEDLGCSFPWILILLSASFGVRLIYPNNNFFVYLWIIIIYSLSLLIASYIYRKSKNRKNQSFITLINESILISILLCFVCYVLLFSVLKIASINQKNEQKTQNLSILFNLILTSIALILLTSYKDIFFSLTLFIVEGGIFSYNKGLLYRENLSVFIIVIFLIISVLYTVKKFKKRVFGYDRGSDIIIVNIEQNNSQ